MAKPGGRNERMLLYINRYTYNIYIYIYIYICVWIRCNFALLLIPGTPSHPTTAVSPRKPFQAPHPSPPIPTHHPGYSLSQAKPRLAEVDRTKIDVHIYIYIKRCGSMHSCRRPLPYVLFEYVPCCS